MSNGDAVDGSMLMSVAALKQAIEAVAPDAVLTDPRIIRRVIRLDRRLTGLGLRVPHRKTYTIERARLFAYVDPIELGATAELAPVTILLSRPSERDLELRGSRTKLLLRYWRFLFHARVHLELESRYPCAEQRQAIAKERRRQLGELEFAEIRSVLLQDRYLFQEHTDWEAYVEFTAVSLDRKYFSPEELEYAFPAITDWESVKGLWNLDLRHAELYQTTRLVPHSLELSEVDNVLPLRRRQLGHLRRRLEIGPRGDTYKWRQRALRSSQVGNHLKAAICWRLAANSAKGKSALLRESSLTETKILVDKLRQALRQDESSIDEWLAGLIPILNGATASFWSAEARMLYELQKISVESEAGSSRANLFRWLTSLGREPMTRSLPLLQHVLIAKHIRSAQRRLGKTRLGISDHNRIATLLDNAEHHTEKLLRETIRPLIGHQFDQVGLRPENVPEQVARSKIVEEMLDNMVEYGYVTSGTFRDALSKGDLKLRDVTGSELLFGDQFLLADRKLSKPLDGVYRPAPVYLRWSQRLSSLTFGTEFGRFITMHLALPFGGAFLAVEGIRHVIALFAGTSQGESAKPGIGLYDSVTTELPKAEMQASGAGEIYQLAALVLSAGLLFYLLMHRPRFRAACTKIFLLGARCLQRLFIALSNKLQQIRLIEQLLYSPACAPLRTYLIKPGLLTVGLFLASQPFLPAVDFHIALVVYFALAMFLNSPVGRYVEEWFPDLFLRTVKDLRARVFGVFFLWIMEVSQRLLTGLDRILHTMDEWSRFRPRDSRLVKIGKFITGSLWAVIAYFIILVSTLLIEPQINPIKHFPVVTVSHKLLLPMGPFFVVRLSPFIGTAQANTLVWSTIWLIPGVFGFLLWELRGNWRLYAANRPQTLQSQAVGHHGETIMALLRPTLHSGTIPRMFARLRGSMERYRNTGNKKQLSYYQVELIVIQRRVERFVERELIDLLDQSSIVKHPLLAVHSVRLATNRIQVAVSNSLMPDSRLWISWEYFDKHLAASVTDDGLLATLSPSQRESLAFAVTGLFQRTGVEDVKSCIGNAIGQPITWYQWVGLWSSHPPKTSVI